MKLLRVLFVAIGALSLSAVSTAGADPKFQPTVKLRSGYSPDGIAAFGEKRATRSIRLALEGPADGSRGQLILNPNEQNFNKFGRQIGETLLKYPVLDVTLKLIEEDMPSGLKCYEVQTTQLDQKLVLVVPKNTDGLYKLMIGAKGKQQTVLLLEAE